MCKSFALIFTKNKVSKKKLLKQSKKMAEPLSFTIEKEQELQIKNNIIHCYSYPEGKKSNLTTNCINQSPKLTERLIINLWIYI